MKDVYLIVKQDVKGEDVKVSIHSIWAEESKAEEVADKLQPPGAPFSAYEWSDYHVEKWSVRQ